jgi:hypothetical protein
MVTDTGRRRHSVYFSVIEEEWPQVRQHLESRLARINAQVQADAAGRPPWRQMLPNQRPMTRNHSRRH